MKRKFFVKVIIAIGTILCSSCTIDYCYSTYAYVINNSGHDMTLFGYSTKNHYNEHNHPFVYRDTMILQNIAVDDTAYIGLSSGDDGYYVDKERLIGDTIRITYNDGVSMDYYRDGLGYRNDSLSRYIFVKWKHMPKADEERCFNAYYTITQEDYEQAANGGTPDTDGK